MTATTLTVAIPKGHLHHLKDYHETVKPNMWKSPLAPHPAQGLELDELPLAYLKKYDRP